MHFTRPTTLPPYVSFWAICPVAPSSVRRWGCWSMESLR